MLPIDFQRKLERAGIQVNFHREWISRLDGACSEKSKQIAVEFVRSGTRDNIDYTAGCVTVFR
jgi:hypothetical protein